MADTLFKMFTAFLLVKSKIQKALKQRFICSCVKILLKLRDSLFFHLSLCETLPIPLKLTSSTAIFFMLWLFIGVFLVTEHKLSKLFKYLPNFYT